MISLGNLFKKKEATKLLHIQCCHCGRWFNTRVENVRAMSYCSDCLD